MDKIIRIACIGSRNITDAQKEICFEIGRYIVRNGWCISSGNADGADCYYAKGGNSVNPKNVIIYLPWATYNKEYLVEGNRVLSQPKEEWYDLTAPFHGGWSYLKRGVKSLMARNYGIIYRADKLLAFLNHNKPGFGGTGQAWRIAEGLNIPRLDLNNKTIGEIINWLENKK